MSSRCCQLLLAVVVVAVSTEAAAAGPQPRPNVLFIAIDDLRPELGCYGSPVAVTPHLDALSARGRQFDRAYCQQAICRPSRASLMTGARPESTGLFHNDVGLRDLQPDIITLPQHLASYGYQTAYCGKIFHHGDTDEARSWTREAARIGGPKPVGFADPTNLRRRNQTFRRMFERYGEAARRGLASGPAYERADVSDRTYADGYETLRAIATIREMATDTRPWFMALGFKKPHLNWTAPEKYWALYDGVDIPLTEQTAAPDGGAAMGLHASFELRTRDGIPKSGPIDDDLARTLKHAYLACVSYVDAQIGLALAALREQGLAENTIIIVWSDHGWHLGEMGVWGKATDYEIATRVPLLIDIPDAVRPIADRGTSTAALVELVDIAPTLCELTGTPLLPQFEGTSFVPLLDEPSRQWKTAAFTEYPNPALREWAANPLSAEMRDTFFGPLIAEVEERIIAQQADRWDRELFEQHLVGRTMRTDRYRLVVWQDRRDRTSPPLFLELYDHQTDPAETVNIATTHPETVEKLLMQFRGGWQAAQPEKR